MACLLMEEKLTCRHCKYTITMIIVPYIVQLYKTNLDFRGKLLPCVCDADAVVIRLQVSAGTSGMSQCCGNTAG